MELFGCCKDWLTIAIATSHVLIKEKGAVTSIVHNSQLRSTDRVKAGQVVKDALSSKKTQEFGMKLYLGLVLVLFFFNRD